MSSAPPTGTRCVCVSFHRFWLEGRQLRSNFGTTKYCATYLRNSPCSNPECLYLHELGDEEDRFTKEEIQQRSLLAPPIPPGAVTVTGAGGPSGTGKRCTSPFLPPPVYESPENGPGAGGSGSASAAAMRGSQVQQAAAGAGVGMAQRGIGRGAKPIGQVRGDDDVRGSNGRWRLTEKIEACAPEWSRRKASSDFCFQT